MRAAVLGTVVVVIAVTACEKSPEKKAEDQAAANARLCTKIDALLGGSSPRQRDECLGQLAFLGPNARACFEPCVERAKDRGDYDVCKDECTSREGLAGTICTQGYLLDEPGKAACMSALVPLEKADRAKLACIGKCRRDPSALEADECSKKCGGPPLPPRNKGGPPVVPPVTF